MDIQTIWRRAALLDDDLHLLPNFTSTHTKPATDHPENGFRSSWALYHGRREWYLAGILGTIASGDDFPPGVLRDLFSAASEYGATEVELRQIVSLSGAFYGSSRATRAWELVQDFLPPTPSLSSATTPYGPLSNAGRTEYLVALHDHFTRVIDYGPNESGPGVPTLLIHALGLDGVMWDGVGPALAQQERRVLAYDLRGHGYAKGAPPTKDLSHLATDLAELLDKLGIKVVNVYGQSYGGAVAQHFVLEHPSRVRSAAFITTASMAQPSWLTRATRAEEATSVLPLLPETIIRWFSPEAIAANAWGVRYARACIENISVSDWAIAWNAMGRLDTRSRIHQVQCPVLVVCGAQDASTGPLHMKALVDQINGAKKTALAKYAELDPGRHMVALEQSTALSKVLIAFRNAVDDGSHAAG